MLMIDVDRSTQVSIPPQILELSNIGVSAMIFIVLPVFRLRDRS